MIRPRTALLLAVAACTSSASRTEPDAGPAPAPAIDAALPAATATPDAASPPANDLPVAKGDPCRGAALPAEQHFLAPGLCARVVATNIPKLRQLEFAPNGDLFGSTYGAIYLLRDADGDGVYQPSEIREWARTATTVLNGNNSHLDVAGGFLYAGSESGVVRFPYAPEAVTGGAGEAVVIDQPQTGHRLRTVRVYDGWLYVSSGSSENAFNDAITPNYDTNRALVKRFDLSKLAGRPFTWNEGEVFTVGLRNANGFVRNETTKRMYAVVNGIDGLAYRGERISQDNPGEEVVELAAGRQYGFPICFTAQRVVVDGGVVAPGTQLLNPFFNSVQTEAFCATGSSPPATFLQAHSAPLDLVFFDRQPRGVLPERWRGGAFIAMHGSTQRLPDTGYKVVWLPFRADGSAPMPTSTATTTQFPYEVVFGGGDTAGARDGKWTWAADGGAGETPRFAGVTISPIDGALYVSSDASGMLYRVGLRP